MVEIVVSASVTTVKMMRNHLDKMTCQLPFRAFANGLFEVGSNQGDSIVVTVEADGRIADIIGDNQIEIFAFEFVLGISNHILGFGSKTDYKGAVLFGCHRSHYIWIAY